MSEKKPYIDPTISVYGIRHHGPGSATNLLRVLENQKPDCILIEGPTDANDLLVDLDCSQFYPPIAILVYTPQNLEKAAFFPFVSFSPEWVGIQYAKSHKIPVRFIDLPTGIKLQSTAEKADFSTPLIIRDPIGAISRAQGFKDVESWWEAHFELLESEQVFTEIKSLISMMRESYSGYIHLDYDNQYREAFMREQIRYALKEGFSNIAVVCGAWHTSALEEVFNLPAALDKTLLKGLLKQKTNAIWVPWSYKKLSKEHGYGAGVSAPMWYEILHNYPENPGMHWMAYTAHELRRMGYETPPSLSIDATVLANNLAALRELPKPGYKELMDASIAVFGYTDESMIKNIYENIPIGDKIGKLPESAARLPIHQDFESRCKELRLTKELSNSYAVSKQLDLRKELHRNLSAFLHQLNQLGIPWGKKSQKTGLGTFREDWDLSWDPHYYFTLIDAGTYGLTIFDAAIQKSIEHLADGELQDLILLLEQSLEANLLPLIPHILSRISDLSYESKDVFALLKSFNAISKLLVAGHSKHFDVDFLQALRRELLLYITLKIQEEANVLNGEKADQVYKDILLADHYLIRLEIPDLYYKWEDNLLQLALKVNQINAIHGACFRLMSDRNKISTEKQPHVLSGVFSMQQTYEESAYWLNGFFQDSFLILLYNETIWSLLNRWIEQMPADIFISVVPLLRRAFGACDDLLKGKIFKKVGGIEETPIVNKDELPEELIRQIDRLLGG